MAAPRRPRLEHVQVRLRVSVDSARWADVFGSAPEDVPEEVRRYAVDLIRASAAARQRAIAAVRRDGT